MKTIDSKLSVPEIDINKVKKKVITQKESVVAKKDTDIKTEATKRKNELTEKLNNQIGNMQSEISGFTTISLMNRHPSVYAHTNNQIRKTNHESKPLLNMPMNDSIVFSPHLENASIMKLLIIIVMILCLTQVFITYRSIIYQFIDRLQSNRAVHTTFKYVF